MVLIPQAFPATPEALASFDFVDLANGLGTEIFFGTTSKDFASAVTGHLLATGDSFAAANTTRTASEGAFTTTFDTSTFNLPRTVKGTAYVSCGLGLQNSTAHIAAQVSIVDKDSNATTISSLVSGSTVTVGGTATAHNQLIPLSLTETRIKRGELLRLTVILQQTSAGQSEFGHDPQNTDGTELIPSTQDTTTVMRLIMPFRVDI